MGDESQSFKGHNLEQTTFETNFQDEHVRNHFNNQTNTEPDSSRFPQSNTFTLQEYMKTLIKIIFDLNSESQRQNKALYTEISTHQDDLNKRIESGISGLFMTLKTSHQDLLSEIAILKQDNIALKQELNVIRSFLIYLKDYLLSHNSNLNGDNHSILNSNDGPSQHSQMRVLNANLNNINSNNRIQNQAFLGNNDSQSNNLNDQSNVSNNAVHNWLKTYKENLNASNLNNNNNNQHSSPKLSPVHQPRSRFFSAADTDFLYNRRQLTEQKITDLYQPFMNNVRGSLPLQYQQQQFANSSPPINQFNSTNNINSSTNNSNNNNNMNNNVSANSNVLNLNKGININNNNDDNSPMKQALRNEQLLSNSFSSNSQLQNNLSSLQNVENFSASTSPISASNPSSLHFFNNKNNNNAILSSLNNNNQTSSVINNNNNSDNLINKKLEDLGFSAVVAAAASNKNTSTSSSNTIINTNNNNNANLTSQNISSPSQNSNNNNIINSRYSSSPSSNTSNNNNSWAQLLSFALSNSLGNIDSNNLNSNSSQQTISQSKTSSNPSPNNPSESSKPNSFKINSIANTIFENSDFSSLVNSHNSTLLNDLRQSRFNIEGLPTEFSESITDNSEIIPTKSDDNYIMAHEHSSSLKLESTFLSSKENLPNSLLRLEWNIFNVTALAKHSQKYATMTSPLFESEIGLGGIYLKITMDGNPLEDDDWEYRRYGLFVSTSENVTLKYSFQCGNERKSPKLHTFSEGSWDGYEDFANFGKTVEKQSNTMNIVLDILHFTQN